MADKNADAWDLTMNEKLDRVLAELTDFKTRLTALEAQKINSKRQRPRRNPHSDVWLDYRDAAEMMRCPAAYFRRRNGLGEYECWPQIERWQPGGRRTRLYVRREHVEVWIKASRTPPTSRINMPRTGAGYEGAVPALLRIKGGEYVVRRLGLGHLIPSKPKPEKREGRRVSTKTAKKGQTK